jgi:hypothetical protein
MLLYTLIPSTQAVEPNDDFASRTVLSAGVATVIDTITGGNGQPDTVLGAFNETLTTEIAFDDDSSPLGDGLASALYGAPINVDGSIRLKVSGWDDYDFDGLSDTNAPGNPHQSEGDMELFVRVYNSSATLIATFSVSRILAKGSVETFTFSDTSWIGGTFDVEIDNTIDPVDYWEFTGLTPGTAFTAEVTCCASGSGGFDAYMGWFDSTGQLTNVDDDSGAGLLPKLAGTVPSNGRVVLAVTGAFGFSFSHKENGNYTLQISGVQISQPDGNCAPFGSPNTNGDVNAADYLVAMRIALGMLSAEPQDLFPCDLYPPGAPDGAITPSDLILLLPLVQSGS